MSLRRIDSLIAEIQAATLGEVISALYCRRGHKLSPDNLTSINRCRQCHNQSNKDYYSKKSRLVKLLPAQPLADWICKRERLFEDGMRGLAIHIAANLGKDNFKGIEAQLWRACQPEQLMLFSTVDKLCCGMGLHANDVYGRTWWEMAA